MLERGPVLFSILVAMAVKTDASHGEKLKKFLAETSADENVARYYLECEKWNLETALAGFKQMKLEEEQRSVSRSSGGKGNCDRPKHTEKGDRIGPLRRGLSMANSELVANARLEMENNGKVDGKSQSDLPQTTRSFILPNITVVKDQQLVEALKKDLIDKATYQSLTKAGVLNWWSNGNVSACRKLFPMSTVGDGNCLLHAVSLGMWGFHDRLLTLRRALYHSLTSESATGALKRRWMFQQWKLNMEAGGLCFTPDEWKDEWEGIVRLASDKPRGQKKAPLTPRKISKQYSIATSSIHDELLKRTDSEGSDSFDSLEEFHVLALAHVLRRPIIVISDTMLRDLEGQPLQPIHFGGIYLPIECDPAKCYKYPLVLGYDSGHFAALVPAEGEDVGTNKITLSSSVPLTNSDIDLLPLQFITDPGETWLLTSDDSKKKKLPELSKQEKLHILSKYLHIVKVTRPNERQSILPAFQANVPEEFELDASDLGSFFRKKSKEGKQIISKAFENITTLMSGHSNLSKSKTSPKLTRKASYKPLYAAKLDLVNRPKYFDDMINNYIKGARKRLQEQNNTPKAVSSRMQCATPGCTFYGSPESNYLCSKCYGYQQEMSRVHKSMPVLREERPPMLRQAQRQLSNPENAKNSEDLLLNFHDRTFSDSFRPATAPPPENLIGTSSPLDVSTSLDDLPERIRLPATAPFPSLDTTSNVGRLTEQRQGTAIDGNKAKLTGKLPANESKISQSNYNIGSVNTEPKLQQKQQQQPNTTTRSFYRRELAQFDPVLNPDIKPFSFERFCRNVGCKIFGSNEYNGFCYSCYSRIHQEGGHV